MRDHVPTRPARTTRRARWYLNRLRCMSAPEIAHRVSRALVLRAERAGLRRAAPRPPDLASTAPAWIGAGAPARIDPYLDAADRIAAGALDVFSLRSVDLGKPPRWNRDPMTGVEAPLTFGMLLDYRDPELVGDHKHLWEPNRHLQLVTLAQAYTVSGDEHYFNALATQLESWFTTCPYRLGPNWSSALEPAIRLINWSIAWQLLGGVDAQPLATARGARLRERWLASVYEHAHFVRGHFSRYSSANNHLIGEAAGLFVAAATWPHWPETGRWLDEAKAILENETLRQNAPDGVNREQAVAYLQFELDLLTLSLLAAGAAGVSLSTSFTARVETMLEYVASIMDVGGNVPAFGDSDDGYVVRLSQQPGFCPYRSLLATGAVLFGRTEFKAKAGALDDKTRWLLGPEADARFEALADTTAGLPVRRAYRDGGYYVLGCGFEHTDEIRLVADAGPTGYGSIAAHGHADALSFTLSVGGREILVDPGTYTYRLDGPWREYFRGTAAHNTVRVDGCDQSESGGPFIWLDKAEAGCSAWEPSAARDVFEGWHDGYTRLPDPVVHRRRIELDKQSRRIVIDDRLEASGQHEVELLFHCSENCRIRSIEGGYAITNGPAQVRLYLPDRPGADQDVRRGWLEPVFGWISRRFGHKQPAPTIRWRATTGRGVLRTELVVDARH